MLKRAPLEGGSTFGEIFAGYWEGDRGRIGHDHHWDRDRDRDHREKERDREHDRR